jgi:RHS repeat-associated protein
LGATLGVQPQGTPVVTSTYDNRDWLASTQNPLGYAIHYTNDAAQRLIATTDPLQRTTALAYDNDSHQISAMDAAGDLTTQSWNVRGNLIKVIDAATNTVGKAYDAANNLAFLTNRNGHVWTFQYDGADRLTNTISPLSHSSSQVYNNRGLLQSSTDPLNRTTTFGYDARGRMTSKADGTGTTTYSPDLNGNLTGITEGSQSIQQSFDAYNRLSSYTDVNGFTVQYRRDANGNVTSLIYPGGLTVNYYYDSNNRLTNVTDWSSRQTAISYDLAGHITSISRPNNTVRSMGYDSDGELTNIVEQTTTKFPICFYTINYNTAGRVQWEFKGPLPHTNTVPTRTMTYDNDNRLATFNSTSVTVDAAGNLTYGPGTNNTFQTYAYDPRNRLTNADGLVYGYDPANNRTFLTNGGAVSVFVTEPQSSQVLMRITGNMTNYYIYGPGLLYEIDVTPAGTTTAFYHFDSRGSTVALTDGNGNPTDLVEYSSYGTTTYRYGTNTTPFLYNGQFGVQSDPNGLLYMRARYYNPYISRFINADPSGFNGGLNFFLFCNDNPINGEDPFGLNGWTSAFGGLQLIGGGFEVAAGVSLGAVTSWTGIGAVGGGLIALHGADQFQAGLQQLFSGNQVDTLTSQGLQAAGVPQGTANLINSGISIVGTAGASFASAPAATGSLVQLTDSAGGAAINSSGTLIGNGGIYAGPLANASQSGLGVTAATGLLPSSYEAAVQIPDAAAGAFSSVTPIGPITGWQAYFGQAYTQAGTLNLTTGAFTQTGLNWGQAAFYGIDASLINGGAAWGTAQSSSTGK